MKGARRFPQRLVRWRGLCVRCAAPFLRQVSALGEPVNWKHSLMTES